MGRELLLNPDRHKRIVAFIKGGTTISNACKAVGISQEAFFSWMRHGKAGKKRYVAFFKDIEEAKAMARVRLEQVIIEAAPEDWRAAAWMLERQHPGEYAARAEVRTVHELPTVVPLAELGRGAIEAKIREIDAKKLNGGGSNGKAD